MTGRLALMEDDTVLCADCVQEHEAEGLPATPATMVYAWLATPTVETCRCCGEGDVDERQAS
jgi:hypothetical protein